MVTTNGATFAASTTEGFRLDGTVCSVAFQVVEEIPVGETVPVSVAVDALSNTDGENVYKPCVIDGGVIGCREEDTDVTTPPDVPQGLKADFGIETVRGEKDDIVLVDVSVLNRRSDVGSLQGQLVYDEQYLELVKHPDLPKNSDKHFLTGEVLRESAALFENNGAVFA
jgi:hypothetical protein